MSDVVVRSFALWLSQVDLQCDERSHRHMEEDLPHVTKFIQIHVTEADHSKGQK